MLNSNLSALMSFHNLFQIFLGTLNGRYLLVQKSGNRCVRIDKAVDENSGQLSLQSLRSPIKLRCDSRFQRAFYACNCVFKVITLVGSNQGMQ